MSKWRYKRIDADGVTHFLDTKNYRPMDFKNRVGVCGTPLVTSKPVHGRTTITCIACIGAQNTCF